MPVHIKNLPFLRYGNGASSGGFFKEITINQANDNISAVFQEKAGRVVCLDGFFAFGRGPVHRRSRNNCV